MIFFKAIHYIDHQYIVLFYFCRNNCERDALIVGCVNSFTSIYASIPIFAILGFKANENNNNCQNW